MPETCGVAIDVPDSTTEPVPVPMPVETTDVPGAIRSGLSRPSPIRGPCDENEAMREKLGFGRVAFDSVAVVAAASDAPSVAGAPSTPKNGIVTIPPPVNAGMSPSNTG